MPVGSGGQAYALVDEPRETHRVARDGVYIFPDSHEIDDRYLVKALPVIHAQLAKAAVRVAGGAESGAGAAVGTGEVPRLVTVGGRRIVTPQNGRLVIRGTICQHAYAKEIRMADSLRDPLLSKTVMPTETVTERGAVEYFEIGDGPAVVSLHGAMGGWDQSLILAQTIGNSGYRYLAMTRPGYLGTPMRSGRSPEQQGDLIASLLDALRIPKAGVMAVSGGGPAAVHFGLRHPARCAGLILVSTCCDPVDTPIPFSFTVMKFLARWPWFATRFRAKAERNLERVAKRSIRDPGILARTLADADIWPLFQVMLLSTFDRMGQRIAGTDNDIAISHSTTYPLEHLKVPVLVIHGTQDHLVPFEANAKMYQTRVPHAELLAIEGGEHVAIFTHHRIVRPRVLEFMQHHFTA